MHCAFPSGQFISDHCTIEYCTASGPHITQTSNRQDNDQVLVLLLEGLQPETLYNYTVSVSNDILQLKVNVEGFLPPEPEIGDLCFWWFLAYVYSYTLLTESDSKPVLATSFLEGQYDM